MTAPVKYVEEVATTAEPSVGTLLQLAIEKGVDVEGLEKLVALHERVMDRQARQEFAVALAEFQRKCPPIQKTSTAKIVTSKGSRYEYNYAELDEIARTVNPILADLGLSYAWNSVVENGLLKCVCNLRHVNGHSEPAEFTCPVDGSPSMSVHQKHAATLTYAKRQALVQVLGITTSEPDTDAVSTETINTEEQDQLQELLEASGMDRARLFRFVGVQSDNLADIPRSVFPAAKNLLRAAYKKQAEDAE